MLPDYLKQVKINVKNHEQSEAVQRALFKPGFEWLSSNKVIQYTHAPWLFVNDSGELTYSKDYLWGKNNNKYTDITDQISFIGDAAVFEFNKEENSKGIENKTDELPKKFFITITDKEHYKRVQKHLFSLGYKWFSGSSIVYDLTCIEEIQVGYADNYMTHTFNFTWGANNGYIDLTNDPRVNPDATQNKLISEVPATNLVPNTVGVSTDPLDKQIQSLAQQMREEANEALRKAGYTLSNK